MDQAALADQAEAMEPTPADFDECFRLHFPRLVSILGAANVDAEAAVQEAFIEAHLRWRKVSRLQDPIGWVRRVAIRRILNQHRSLGRRSRAVERLGGDPANGGGRPDPADSQRTDLAGAVAGLPLRQRLALVLHHLEDLPVRQVAEAMGTSEGTVKSQLHDARAALRPLLEVHDD